MQTPFPVFARAYRRAVSPALLRLSVTLMQLSASVRVSALEMQERVQSDNARRQSSDWAALTTRMALLKRELSDLQDTIADRAIEDLQVRRSNKAEKTLMHRLKQDPAFAAKMQTNQVPQSAQVIDKRNTPTAG